MAGTADLKRDAQTTLTASMRRPPPRAPDSHRPHPVTDGAAICTLTVH